MWSKIAGTRGGHIQIPEPCPLVKKYCVNLASAAPMKSIGIWYGAAATTLVRRARAAVMVMVFMLVGFAGELGLGVVC